MEKTCKQCRRVKGLSKFHNSVAYKDGKNSTCAECTNSKNSRDDGELFNPILDGREKGRKYFEMKAA